ncbi:MAG: penicillin-insensitive murein endopeptidase [Rhizobiaceae bacterium]
MLAIRKFKNSLSTFIVITMLAGVGSASAEPIAKKLFGAKRLPAVMKPAVHGFYSKGCVQGAVAIPTDGPTWQAMRLHRNRRWGHPDLVKMVVKLSQDGRKVGWNGLLVGDISQPRGGPMLTGHASHQLGLDADVWLTPMPNRRLSRKERKNLSATSMLRYAKNKRGKRYLDQNHLNRKVFTRAHFGIIKTAASYKNVQRVLVHPTIKKELCRLEKGNRKWLHKVRPYWGHHYHMHIRLHCPPGSPNCRPQARPKASDGCGAELKYWHRVLNPPKPKPRKPGAPKRKAKKRKPKPQIRMANLPRACRVVLNAAGPKNELAATLQIANGHAFVPKLKVAPAVAATAAVIAPKQKATVTLPKFRPSP